MNTDNFDTHNTDRRTEDRRESQLPFTGSDRRVSERRSGRDRRVTKRRFIDRTHD